MTPFRSARDGYLARWEPLEREVLARVARDVAELLRAESGIGPDVQVGDGVAFTGVGRVPHDPAVQRLLPDAHRDDPDVAADFRHLTQTDIAATKVARLEAFADKLYPAGAADGPDGVLPALLVPRDEADAFAGALTDVRLVIAERLGLEDDDDVELLDREVLAGVMAEDDGFEESDGAEDGPEAEATERRRYWGGVFVAARFAQESLVDEMLADLRARRREG